MSKCPGVHCPGCGSGPVLSGGAVAVLAGVAVFAYNRRAIDHAAGVAVHVLTIMVFVIVGLALAGIGTAAVITARRAFRPIERPAVPRTVEPLRVVSIERQRPAAALPAPARTTARPAARRALPQAQPRTGQPGRSNRVQ